MKTAIILLLIVSALILGCTKETPQATPNQLSASSEVTQQEALNEVNNSLLPEDNDIEIGEMI